jgi:hypothetical protein
MAVPIRKADVTKIEIDPALQKRAFRCDSASDVQTASRIQG